MNNLSKIINSWKTVFNKNDLRKIWNFPTSFALDKFIQRSKENWILENPFYWIYTFKKYNIFEFACKLRKFSYISFETVLQKEWVVFQDYWSMIFLASDDTGEKNVNGNFFKFNKLKNTVLLNPLWIYHKGTYMIASKERAICDRVYLSKNYYFDNLDWINLEKLKDISQIYNNKRVILEINQIINDVK